MAIIDSNKLLNDIKGNRKERIGIKVVQDTIKAQPPVPAIPWEWIMAYMERTVISNKHEGETIVKMVREWIKERDENNGGD